MDRRRGFTLLELIVVIAILAVLAVAVVVVLNPAQLLARSRDSTRMTDLIALRDAINLSFVDDIDPDGDYADSCVGEPAPKVFFSVPSGESPPPLPQGWSANQVAKSDLGNTGGTGWMPVKLASVSLGSPISHLPIDPVNSFASGLYYTYACSRNPHYELTGRLEASQYLKGGSQDRVSNDSGDDPFVYEIGSNLQLDPLAPSAYWAFDEGVGSTTEDASLHNNQGTLQPSFPANSPAWQIALNCKAGPCLSFDGTDDRVDVSDSSSLRPSMLTIEAWVNPNASQGANVRIVSKGKNSNRNYVVGKQGTKLAFFYYDTSSSLHIWQTTSAWSSLLPANSWSYTVVTYTSGSGSSLAMYVNGVAVAGSWTSGNGNMAIGFTAEPLRIGSSVWADVPAEFFRGSLDSISIYNRILSSSEITQHNNTP